MARPSVPTSGCSSPGRANPSAGTDAPTRPSGPHLRASRLSGSASRLQQGRFGTDRRKRVSVLMTSHRFLLADWSRGEGLGIASPHLGCHIVGSLASQVSSTCAQLVLLVTLLALCFLRSHQAQRLDIMAGHFVISLPRALYTLHGLHRPYLRGDATVDRYFFRPLVGRARW